MTFQEAKDRLAVIAGGEYRSLLYELTIDHEGVERAECRVYANPGLTSGTKPTWAEAFAALEAVMNPPAPPAPLSMEAPGDELG